jgi:hypothetical protein
MTTLPFVLSFDAQLGVKYEQAQGCGTTWGAKANDKLVVTRGKGFRLVSSSLFPYPIIYRSIIYLLRWCLI